MLVSRDGQNKLRNDLLGVLSDIEFSLDEREDFREGIKKHVVVAKLIGIVHNILKGKYD